VKLTGNGGVGLNPFLFGGQFGYYTDYGGIILCGARWYDPAQGRWLSRDPIDYEGGDNLYGYGAQNPILLVDPSGLAPTQQGREEDPDEIITGLPRNMTQYGASHGTALALRRAHGRLFVPMGKALKAAADLNPGVAAIKASGRDPYTARGRVSRLEQGLAVAQLVAPGLVEAALGKVYKSFSAFKRAKGLAGTGKAWHHIVEQCKVAEFGAKIVNSEKNLVKIDAELNGKLNGLYSSIRFDITGSTTLRVRDWLKNRSFQEQYQFGLKAMEKVRKGEW
jgi:RHS repeat-associated protein